MNMLNTEMRAYQSFCAIGRNLIVGIIKSDMAEQLNCNGDWINKEYGTVDKNGIYRLKLKEETYYTFEANGSTLVMPFLKQSDGAIYFRDDNQTKSFPIDTFEHIQLSTQSEIDSVKPEFKRGDVVTHYYDNNDVYTMRMKNVIQNNHASGYSRIAPKGKFGWFIPNGMNLSKASKATPSQIKKLELEEMKHGKKWNGDGYDDWLTADGLTINEITKHGVENIQFDFSGDRKDSKEWRQTSHSSIDSVISEMLFCTESYRLKPKDEGFVDVLIHYSDGQSSIKHPESNGRIYLHEITLGAMNNHWVPKEYYDKSGDVDTLMTQPIHFVFDSNEVRFKATHLRFVKL